MQSAAQHQQTVLDRMPWGIYRHGRLVAYAWTRHAAESATGWAGTYRGCKPFPRPVVSRRGDQS